MSSGKIIWLLIVIGVGVYILWQFGFRKSDNKCCRVELPKDMQNLPDMPTTQYCIRGGRYFVTISGGISGGEVETEISQEDYNKTIQKFTCI